MGESYLILFFFLFLFILKLPCTPLLRTSSATSNVALVEDWVPLGMVVKGKEDDDGDDGTCETNANSSSSFSTGAVSVWHKCAWSMVDWT